MHPGKSFALAFVLAFSSFGFAAEAGKPDAADVDFQWGVKVPLRDGVKLNATLYRPHVQKDALPCIFTLTPYIAQSYHDRAMYFAAHGFVFATIDVRGRGNSEGEFTPLLQEAKDGHDIVEWLAQQPYCNGKVSMWGGSYAGYDQWATAKEFPPHLSSIVPVASPYAGIDFPRRNNIAYPYDVQWLMFTSGHASQDKIFGDGKFWTAKFSEFFLQHLAFNDIDKIIGNPSPIFQTWVKHPMRDAYWDSFNPSAAQLAKIDLPILTITGQYDGDQPGALMYYTQHMANASEHAKAQHYLIIGPWDHPGTRTPQAELGGLKFAAASVLDMNKLHEDWWNWTLKAGAKPAFLKNAVAYYMSVAEQWRYADTLVAVTAEQRPLYLGSAGNAADVFTAGSLQLEKSASAKPDSYQYDPLDVSSAARDAIDVPNSLTDQRSVIADSGKQLVYHSGPFEHDTDLAGFFRFSAWMTLDQPDTDFHVVVYEISADGSSVYLSDDQMRARYRESDRRAKLVPKNTVQKYDFDHFTFTARQIRKGSRLRLVISSMNSLFNEKNYNAGGVVGEETGKDARTVTVKLYHDAQHASALYLPIAAADHLALGAVADNKPAQ